MRPVYRSHRYRYVRGWPVSWLLGVLAVGMVVVVVLNLLGVEP